MVEQVQRGERGPSNTRGLLPACLYVGSNISDWAQKETGYDGPSELLCFELTAIAMPSPSGCYNS